MWLLWVLLKAHECSDGLSVRERNAGILSRCLGVSPGSLPHRVTHAAPQNPSQVSQDTVRGLVSQIQQHSADMLSMQRCEKVQLIMRRALSVRTKWRLLQETFSSF